jgi:hypothetical protein
MIPEPFKTAEGWLGDVRRTAESVKKCNETLGTADPVQLHPDEVLELVRRAERKAE